MQPKQDSSWGARTHPRSQPIGVSARYPRGHAVPGVCQGRQGAAPSSAEFQERPWQSAQAWAPGPWREGQGEGS